MDKPFSSPYMAGFIRMPPSEMDIEEARKNPLFVDPDALPAKEHLARDFINRKAFEFECDGNPIHAFEAFVRSIESGIYPPMDVLRWMADSLQQHLASEGTKDLDKCFGTKGGASGQDPAYKRLLIKRRRDNLMGEMATLIGLGATRWEAAEMVAAKASLSGPHSKQKLRDIEARSLETYHKQDKVNRDPEAIEWLKHHPHLVRDLLAEYPHTPGSAKLLRKYKR